MKLYRRMKRSTKQYIIVALLCVLIIGSAAVFTTMVLYSQIKSEYQALLNNAYHDMKANQKYVYVAVNDINAGDVIQQDLIEKKLIYTSQPSSTYISEDEIGNTSLIAIPAGTQILHTMLTDDSVSDELREIEYQVITINSNINNNDTVDVRLCYPNGECYVVLSKKLIRGYTSESTSCYLWNTEEEILRMQAAIVDASLYPGSTMFVTKYIEPNIQTASIVNYTPSISILSLIERDPNIIDRASQELGRQVRKSLEDRLAGNLGKDIAVVNRDTESEEPLTITPMPIPNEDSDIGSSVTSEEEKTDIMSEADKELGSNKTDNYFYFAREDDIEYGK